MHGKPLRPFGPPPLQGGGVLPPDKPIAPEFKPGAAEPGTVSDAIRVWQNVTPRAEQVSFCRIWADFRDAAFELARRNREKNSFFVQYFMGDFCFLRQSGPEILLPGRKNPSPEKAPKSCCRDEKIRAPKKKFPAPKKKFRAPKFFFRAPFFSDGGLEALFPAIWNFSTDKSPMSICRHKSRPAYAPGNPGAETAAPVTKRKPVPSICRHLGFCTLRETAFFAPATVPCPVQANLRGLQMTKCQISRQIAKCISTATANPTRQTLYDLCVPTLILR